jgi:hypothetical protein
MEQQPGSPEVGHPRPVRAVLATAGVLGALVIVWSVTISLLGTPLTELPPPQRLGRLTFLSHAILGACFLALGAFMAIRVGNREGPLALTGYVVAQGLAMGYLFALLILGVTGSGYSLARVLVNLMAYSLAIRTTQLFPRRLLASDSERIAPGTIMAYLAKPVFRVLGPTRTWTFSALVLLPLVLTGIEALFHVGQFAVIALAVLTMVTNYRVGDAEARRKVYWLLLGAEVLLVGRLAIFVGELTLDWLGVAPGASMRYMRIPAWSLANVGLIACLLTAVLYRGDIDPRLVVRRTAVYTLVTGALVFTFAAFENYVADLVALFLGLPGGLVEALGGGAVALLMKPLHDVLVGFSKRVMPDTVRSEKA